MSKQWYYQVMGMEVGPVSSAELKQKAQLGQIQADTAVRLGPEGKWQTADHVRGLIEPPPEKPTASAASDPGRTAAPAGLQTPAGNSSSQGARADHHPDRERTYHLAGTGDAPDTPEEEEPHEFDFFRFVGFEQALGPALHRAFDEHCRRHRLTFTEVTRRALAEFLGRKDLIEEKSPATAPETTGSKEDHPAGGSNAPAPAAPLERNPA